jgi:hypothetical protein
VFPSATPSGDAQNDGVHGERWRAKQQTSKAAVIMFHCGFAQGAQDAAALALALRKAWL